MPAGSIALIQRRNCTFVEKQENAEQAGAAAVIVFNDGFPGRTEAVWTDASGQAIPVLDAAHRVGIALANGVESGPTGKTAHVSIDWRPGTYTTSNVIAESAGGDRDNVITVGAHLDSVGTGPGINDNGSGSSAILEIAEEMPGFGPRNAMRFIWFGAEESGLLGSEHYVATLPDAERERIAAMLNFDMIGSTNFVRFVYDGDNSSGEGAVGPEGSDDIEAMFLDYFASQGLPTEPTAFDGRSDYGPFIAAGIPAGGLFTGAEGIKTAEQAAIYGGTAGEQYDPCYHEGCDTLLNLSNTALEEMGDAAAHATVTLAQRTPADRPRGNATRVSRFSLPKPAPRTAQ
jgi:Zn-dependent M28 family amino/carboxypeptidase